MKTILLLTISNIFMTFAWYGHLKHKDRALWVVILVSWLIAFLEYCFQVPANRIGHNQGFSAAQLKTIQEIITLVVFADFPVSLELAGVILLMAMWGAVVLARRQIELGEDERREAAGLRRLSVDEPEADRGAAARRGGAA